MTDPFDARLRACRDRLAERADDLVALSPGPNLAYAMGFDDPPSERHLFLFVPRSGEPVVVAPEMYAERLEDGPVDDARLWADDEDPLAVVDDALRDLAVDPDRILVDDRMWATFSRDLRDLRPDAAFGLASAVFEELRIRKDEAELEALRRAGGLADRVAGEIRDLGADVVGRTERELATEIENRLAEYGGLEPAFPTTVAAGPNGARPHHETGDRTIREGDPVVLDFGAFVPADLECGSTPYPGDQTRTVVFAGDPPDEYGRVHELVRKAQQAGVEAVEPGVTAAAVDRAARDVIEDAGYGDAFVHRTGHGVGLEVHEPPYLVAGNDRRLEPGTVCSVEPGIYLEGRFGVRIEDLVVVTGDGAERLNDTPRGWESG